MIPVPEINESTALLITDVQKGFMNDHTIHLPKAASELQSRYPLVIATRFFNREGSSFRTLMGWTRFDHGSEETELAFTPEERTAVLEKPCYGAAGTGYYAMLQQRKIKTIHIIGCDTNMCVLQSAVELFETGHYRPVVLAPCCGSHSGAQYHEYGLKLLEKAVGPEQVWKGA